MKKSTSFVKSLCYRMYTVIGAAALVSGIHNTAHATQTVRELWDGSSGNHPINGVMSNGVSSFGFDASTTWVTSPAGNTSIRFDNWNLDWEIGNDDTLLPRTANGNGGLLAYYGSDGNMDSSLTNPTTSLPYGDYYSQCYAMRALTTNSYIDFKADGTYYLSVSFVGGGGYDWWSGDMAGGIGFAASQATNADFVGAGWARQSPFMMPDGITDAGHSVYVTAGTLDQAGVASHPDDSGGPYYPSAASVGNLQPAGGAYIVAKLVTTPSGASTISVKMYTGAPDTDPSSITWDATYSFTETNVMTQFLAWEYGSGGPRVQDGIRVGTNYSDVVGVEIVGAPKASPGSTEYAGTTITLSTTYAGLNTGTFPMTYQWESNSVPLTDATNSTLVLTGTTTNFTADYTLAVANAYGATTSAVTHVTLLPATPVYITAQPVSITRYVGSPSATFTVAVNGTPPYTYQWKHAGTNFGSPVVTDDLTDTLVLPPIAQADAGNYSAMVTNLFGPTNSAVVTLTEIVPAANSYAAAVTALSPWGYWRMGDNGNADSTIYDYFGWKNGVALDTNNMTFGAAGAPDVGFPTPHNSIYIGNQWWVAPYRLNLPQLPIYATNMTFTMWVKNDNSGVQLLADNGYGNEYGIQNNNGDVQFSWGGITAWDSGLQVPANTWTFVALVVEPTQATVYVGTNVYSLASSVDSGLTLSDSTTLGDTPWLTPLAVGRNPIPWAESGNGSQWASNPGTWSDVAIFYQSLTPQQVTSLYLAGVGVWLDGTPDGSGNLNLNWFPGGILQEATSVVGPYTDVGGDPTPPYSVAISTTTPEHYYRVRK